MSTDNTEVAIPNVLSTSQLQAMISQLSVTEEGEPLQKAMDDLRTALKANPAACASLLPTDIGQMVQALMKVVGKEIEEDTEDKRKSKKTAKPVMTKEIEDDLF